MRELCGWPVLHEDALVGPVGKFVHLIEPQSEADPAALLIQFLAAFGNLIGRRPYFPVEADHHHTGLFVLIVGDTSVSRKGTAYGHIRQIMRKISPTWFERCMGGLSSGEGLIAEATQAHRHRLFVYTPEFARLLRVQRRQNNPLSQIIREAWDGGTLQIMTKNNPMRVSDAHVSIIAHITAQELRPELTTVDQADGFANRFLIACAKRSKLTERAARAIVTQPSSSGWRITSSTLR